MNQQDHQFNMNNSASEAAFDGLLNDLTVHNAEAIKGGPTRPAGGGGGGDIIVFDIIDSIHRP